MFGEVKCSVVCTVYSEPFEVCSVHLIVHIKSGTSSILGTECIAVHKELPCCKVAKFVAKVRRHK